MWNKRSKIYIAISLIIFLILFGYTRDYIFIGINYYIKQKYYNLETDFNPFLYSIVGSLSIKELSNLKWVLTLVFMLVNYAVSAWVLKLLFRDSKNANRLLLWGYVFLFLISALFYLSGILFNSFKEGYILARRFMGVLQSPVPLMVVSAVHLMFYNLKGSVTEK